MWCRLTRSASRVYTTGFEYDVVAVDEIQFFPPSLAEVLDALASRRVVIAASLNLDFRGEPFETTMRAMAYADKVVSLTAVCKIRGRPATRMQRLINGRPAPKSPRILIGGGETYEARCRRHWEGVGCKWNCNVDHHR